VARYARDLPPDRWDRVLFDHAFLGLGIGTLLLCLILGPWLGLLAAGVHAAAYLLISGAVNAIGHRFGSRPHANLATNGQWLAWLAWGEGLHNNHHAAPTSARFALAPGEIDPGWWVISLLQRLGWARVRHDKPIMARSAA
jgi:stearoyl-CoA desaturase (delta-9 desaturase)